MSLGGCTESAQLGVVAGAEEMSLAVTVVKVKLERRADALRAPSARDSRLATGCMNLSEGPPITKKG